MAFRVIPASTDNPENKYLAILILGA